jgi:hypothetical protein
VAARRFKGLTTWIREHESNRQRVNQLMQSGMAKRRQQGFNDSRITPSRRPM